MDVTAQFRSLAPLHGPYVSKKRPNKIRDALFTFMQDAVSMLESIIALEKLMEETEPKYLKPNHFIRIRSTHGTMNEKEKDDFDTEIMELVKSCGDRIDQMKEANTGIFSTTYFCLCCDVRIIDPWIYDYLGSEEQVEHQKEVVTFLLERLKEVANFSKRLQKQRLEQPFAFSSRLLPEEERLKLVDVPRKESFTSPPVSSSGPGSFQLQSATTLSSTATTAGSKTPTSTTSPLLKPLLRPNSKPKSKPKPTFTTTTTTTTTTSPPEMSSFFSSQAKDLSFSEEETQRFHAENITLHRHFQENLEDAQKMESKMAEISNLMSQFADKIMEQQTEIELIHQHAQDTKSNVKQSNDILEQTRQIGNGYGFMIFCFYLIFSILLHLVHYFN